jgi:hypothetical protein
MKFQAKFLKVSGVQDSQGDKYTQVQLRLFHQPDPEVQEETTEHVSMWLMGLLYGPGTVIVDINPVEEKRKNPEMPAEENHGIENNL